MNFNILNMAIAEHYENVDKAIHFLIDLHRDDYDIEHPQVIDAVMRRYGLDDDGFESEREYILEEVKRRIA